MQRLAERELELEPVVFVEIAALQRGLHRGHVVVVEVHGLQIGEAPPGVAERRLQGDRLAIGGETVRLTPDRLQQVAVAQQHSRLCDDRASTSS